MNPSLPESRLLRHARIDTALRIALEGAPQAPPAAPGPAAPPEHAPDRSLGVGHVVPAR